MLKDLDRVRKMKAEDIDLSDIPEVTDWSGAVRGPIYRARKQPVTLRIDRDILLWLKAKGKGYQTRINRLLRAEMMKDAKRRQSA